jgi:hypothetical protein
VTLPTNRLQRQQEADLEGGHQLLCQKRTGTSAVNANASISYTHLFKYTVEAIAADPYSRAG